MTLQNVENELKKLFQTREEQETQQARVDVALMFNELREATPVDTGLAKNSWKVSELPKSFYIENTTEYIQYLNEGSSKQAPSRFIESIALKYGKPFGTIVEVRE